MKHDSRKVNFSPMALQILEKRYLRKTEDGIILETPEQLLFRVAAHVCEGNESLFEEALKMMRNLEFLPNTPTLMNAGTTNMLSACFAIPISDSLESIIHEALWEQASIHKKGGGTGINFSNLRPKGDSIKSTGGVTTGVISFMKNFNVMSGSIHQGGKRDGANMSILSVYHPEIEEFIKVKMTNHADYENMNLSVLVDDVFMEAVKLDQVIALSFPVKDITGFRREVPARHIWDLICEAAHKCGCPGILFEDNINSNNKLDKHGFHITTTNPCWVGDTRIWTIRGAEKIKDLVGTSVEVLTQDNSGQLIFRTMRNIRKTQINSKIIEITIKNWKGKISTLRCTENHNLYLTNGNKIEAKNLKINDSLQSVYRYKANSKGYLELSNSIESVMESHVVASSKYGKRPEYPFEHCHHKVISIKYLKLFEDVYNGIVDETHSYYVVCNDNDAILSANCGEQPLFCGEYNGKKVAESCNLGSIDLSKFVAIDGRGIDWKRLEYAVLVATEFLDKVIDRNLYPFPYIDEGTKLTRKIGLGVTGFSDYLIKTGVPYNSEKAVEEAEAIMRFITKTSHLESNDLGRSYGAYPLAELINDTQRNNMCTTIAPTGTIGRLMLGHGYSSGIEPPFAIYMNSNIIETKVRDGIHPLLIEKLNECMKDNSECDRQWYEKIVKEIAEDGSSIQRISGIPDKIKQLFLTANEIPIEQHIKIQAAFQKHVDNAVSKTINLPNSATVEDVKKAFMLAYESDLKGITIYRDGSKEVQVLNVVKESEKFKEKIELIDINDLSPRPPVLGCLSFTKRTACNTLFINPTYLGNIEKSALESFIDTNGGCVAMRTGLAISISVYQRILDNISPSISRKSLDIVTSHLKKVPCQICIKQIEREKHSKVQHPVDSISCPAAVAEALRFMLEHRVETLIDGVPLIPSIKYQSIINNVDKVVKKGEICEECGTPLIKAGGCASFQCPNCMTGGCG